MLAKNGAVSGHRNSFVQCRFISCACTKNKLFSVLQENFRLRSNLNSFKILEDQWSFGGSPSFFTSFAQLFAFQLTLLTVVAHVGCPHARKGSVLFRWEI